METANILVPITMFGCIAVFLVLFATMEPRRALLASFLGAWLFLPNFAWEIEGIPDYTKLFATCFGIMLAVFVFDFKRILAFRPKALDIPMLIWCLVPLGASITNFGLNREGIYDGMSETLAQIILWGVPYFLGRIYFRNWKELRELAIAMIISGLVYLPLVWIEMRLSPQLHNWVYGYHQHLFHQTKRFGLWRPMVFMQHGLMVAFWMMTVTLTTFWLWRSGSVKRVRIPFTQTTMPFAVIALLFGITTILMVSVNAWVSLGIGLTLLMFSTQFKTRWLVGLFMAIVPLYIILQGANLFPQELAVDFVTGLLGEERAQSLEFRYFNEEYLTEHAREQPIFGWAGWDRQHVNINEYGLKTVADSLWVIFFGKFGTVGLLSLMLSIMLPAILFVVRYPPWIWSHPTLAPAAALSMVLVLYMFDGLLNAMINPLFMLTAGSLMGALANLPELDTYLEKDDSPSAPTSIGTPQPAAS